MSLKIIWKLRERKKELEEIISNLHKSGYYRDWAREDELRFIKELLGEKS